VPSAPVGSKPVSQGEEGRVNAQLKNGVYTASGFTLQLGKGIEIPWIENQRLFADGVGANPQCKTDMGVVEMVRGTDAEKMNPARSLLTPQFLEVPIESLKFSEKRGLGKIAIQNPH